MAISKVQGPVLRNDVSPLTASFVSTPTEGNLLVAFLNSTASTAGITSAAISGFTLGISAVNGSSNGFTSIWYKTAGASESKDVVATIAGGGNIFLVIEEWTGITFSILDKTAYTNDTGSTVSARSSGTTAATTANDELAVACVIYGSTTTAQSWSNSFTDERSGDTELIALGSLVLSSTAAVETTLSWTTARRAAGCIATFKSGVVNADATSSLATLTLDGLALTAEGTNGGGVNGEATSTLAQLTLTGLVSSAKTDVQTISSLAQLTLTGLASSATTTAVPSTYYIDATSGDDGNLGTSSGSPWKTISKINSSTFIPGDTISFKKGETWREQLDVPSSGASGSPITFNAYGSGYAPKVYGSDIPSSSWTQETALYYTALVADPVSIWFIDTSDVIHTGNKVAGKVNLTSEYDWWWDDPNDRLYIYAATDPLTRYHSVEVGSTTRDRGIWWGGITARNYIIIDGFEVAFVNGNGIVIRGNSKITNCIVHHIGLDSDGVHGIGCEINSGNNSSIDHNTIYECYSSGGYLTALYSPYTTSYNVIENNTIYDCGNELIRIKNDATTTEETANIIRYNNVYYNSSFTPNGTMGYGIFVFGLDTCSVNGTQIYYNIIKSKKSGIRCTDYVTNLEIYNNTILAGGVGVYIGSTGGSGHKIKNNIVIDSNTASLLISDSSVISVCDYNCWYTTTGTVYVTVGEANYHSNDFAAYKTATGWDAHGLWQDPEVISTTDFELQSSSPCLNAGVNIGLAVDYAGAAVSDPPEMGAYEYTSSAVNGDAVSSLGVLTMAGLISEASASVSTVSSLAILTMTGLASTANTDALVTSSLAQLTMAGLSTSATADALVTSTLAQLILTGLASTADGTNSGDAFAVSTLAVMLMVGLPCSAVGDELIFHYINRSISISRTHEGAAAIRQNINDSAEIQQSISEVINYDND
jgi:hypothetical protein